MATISPSTAEIVRQSGAIPGAEYLLEVSNVRKAFPGVLALDDVSFRLKRGHVHALILVRVGFVSMTCGVIDAAHRPAQPLPPSIQQRSR